MEPKADHYSSPSPPSFYSKFNMSLTCCCSVAQSCPMLYDYMGSSIPALPELTISQSLPKFMSIHQWYHPVISSSDALFSFCPQSLPASGTFPKGRLLASRCQNTGAPVSASVLPLRLTGLISSLSKGLSGVSSSTIVWKHQFFGALHFLWSSSHNHM